MFDGQTRSLLRFGLLGGLLGAFCTGTTLLLGPEPVAVSLFVVPVAAYWSRGQTRRATVLIGVAAAAGFAGALLQALLLRFLVWAAPEQAAAQGLTETSRTWTVFATPLFYAIVAGLGVAIAVAAQRRWRYGQVVALVCGTGAALIVGTAAATWHAWVALGRASFEPWLRLATDNVDASTDARAAASREALEFLSAHIGETMFGLYFWLLLGGSCLLVSACFAVIRRYAGNDPQGSFMTMRPSDWLVWAVIAGSGLWFLENRYYDSFALRLVAWNGLIALAAVYFVNGLSVLGYGIKVLQPGFLAYAACVFIIVLLSFYPVLLLGLFDTWGEFRRKIDRMAALRKEAEDGPGRDDF